MLFIQLVKQLTKKVALTRFVMFIPEEGSNIWFDGWVMPKGANKELAQEFLNFMADPEVAY